MKSRHMSAVFDKVRYDTEKSTLIADNAWWDGHNFERSGRNTFLYRGGKTNRYFAAHQTCWQGERDHIEPLTQDKAIELYEQLGDDKAMDFESAFPEVEVTEA